MSETRMETKRPPTSVDKRNRFNQRFASNDMTGVSKLTSIGCMERFNVHRSEMLLTDSENKTRNFERWNRTEYEERIIQLNLFKAFHKLGYKLRPNESAEELLQRVVDDGHNLAEI